MPKWLVDKLLQSIGCLRCAPIRGTIDRRLSEFAALGKRPSRDWFKELCFCVLTANFNAERGIAIQEKIGDGFISLPESQLAAELRRLGYRYPNTRAKYIAANRGHVESLKDELQALDTAERRDWLAKNIVGLGYKEASHFLRNVGYGDYAIIDFHIVDLLAEHGLVERPKTMSKKAYLCIEERLAEIARRAGLTQGELDLYLWYLETGKILK